jgi:hypothetical protein
MVTEIFIFGTIVRMSETKYEISDFRVLDLIKACPKLLFSVGSLAFRAPKI